MKNFTLFLLLCICLCYCNINALGSEKPDVSSVIVFTNGTFYIDAVRTVKSLAVKDGKVIAHNISGDTYPGFVTVDLGGAAAYPGFHDSHNHLMESGLGLTGVDLNGCNNSDSIAEKVSARAKSIPDSQPIIGVGFSLSDYNAWSLGDLEKIDKSAGGHLCILVDNLGHNAIVNTLTMKKYNITAETVPPPAGVIIIQNGQPTGLLRESAMLSVGEKMMSLFPDELVLKGTFEILSLWAKFGYTSVNDMMGTPMGRLMRPQLFKDMEKKGILPLRINYTYTIFSLDDVDGALAYIGQDTEMVRFIGCKLFIDGGFGAGQAWTSWVNKMGNNGTYYVYSDDKKLGKKYNLNRIVERVDDLKLNIHYHVQGDAGIEAILNALDAVVAKKGRLCGIHTFVHLGFPRKDQIKRMKKFGSNVSATVQPALWKLEADSGKYYGERMKDSYPIKELIEDGVKTGLSTDFSVSPLPYAPPLVYMPIALNPASCIPPTRKPLSMEDLIRGLTEGSAATIPLKDTGTLDIGKKADLVVFDRDLYKVSPFDLTTKVKVLSTWIGGKKIYSSEKIK